MKRQKPFDENTWFEYQIHGARDRLKVWDVESQRFGVRQRWGRVQRKESG